MTWFTECSGHRVMFGSSAMRPCHQRRTLRTTLHRDGIGATEQTIEAEAVSSSQGRLDHLLMRPVQDRLAATEPCGNASPPRSPRLPIQPPPALPFFFSGLERRADRVNTKRLQALVGLSTMSFMPRSMRALSLIHLLRRLETMLLIESALILRILSKPLSVSFTSRRSTVEPSARARFQIEFQA